MYTYLLVVLLTATLVYAPAVATSDSAWLPYTRDRFVFGGIDKQVALIFWQDGYELLLVASSYEGGGNGTGIYLFPLPSKPIVYGVYSVSGTFSIDAYVLQGHGVWRNAFYTLYSGLAGEGGEALRVLAEIQGPGVSISLVEARDMAPGAIEEFAAKHMPGASLPEGIGDVLSHYARRGWRYLVIGEVNVPGDSGTVISLYVFPTDEIVYPLYIDRGVPGPSNVEIIVVSSRPVASVDSGVDGVSLSPRSYRAAWSGSFVVINAGEAAHGIYQDISGAAGFFDRVIEDVGEGGVYVFFTGYMYRYSYTAEPGSIRGDTVMKPGSDLTIYALDETGGGVVPSYVPFILLFLPTPFFPAGLILFLVTAYAVYAGSRRLWVVGNGLAGYLYAVILAVYTVSVAVELYRLMGSVDGFPYVYAYMDMAIPLLFTALAKPALIYALLLHASSVDRSEYAVPAALSLLEPLVLATTSFNAIGIAVAMALSLTVFCYISYRVFSKWERSRFDHHLMALAGLPVAVYSANIMAILLHQYAVYPAILYGLGAASAAAVLSAIYGLYGRRRISFAVIAANEPLDDEAIDL